jgi:hypothetical protein
LAGSHITVGVQEYPYRPVFVGDWLTVTTRLTDLKARRTRDGRPMILVVTEFDIHNQHGDLVLRQVNHDAKLQLVSFKPIEALKNVRQPDVVEMTV